MLIANGDGTFIGGPLDVLVLLRDVNTGRFHACFAEEAPMPGPIGDVGALSFVRLKSKRHHTEGAATREEGERHVDELAAQILLQPENVSKEPVDWDGAPFVTLVENWRRGTPRPVSLAPSLCVGRAKAVR